MKMQKAAMVLFSLVTVVCWSSVPALAQRGRGSGGATNPGGGMGAAGMHGGMQGGMPGSEAGRGPQHPDMEHPGAGRPQMGQEGRERGREGSQEGRMSGRSENRPDAGRRTASEHLAQSPKLSSKIEGLLPAGTNLQQEAAGFKNLGEFVSAAHVSHNLGIPFDQLRTRMASGKSLGDAIHDLKPDVNHKAEAKKAQEQAKKDLKESGS